MLRKEDYPPFPEGVLWLDYQNLVQPLVVQAEQTPERVCLVVLNDRQEWEEIRCAELHAGALAFATQLRQAGVAPNELVLLVLNHSRALFEAFLGALYAQAIPSVYPYLTPKMDLREAAQDIEELLDSAEISTLLTSHAVQPFLARPGRRVLAVDEHAPARLPADVEPLAVDWRAISPEQVAFVQFSSGTTGHKKGVAITHRQIILEMNSLSSGHQTTPARTDVFVTWLPMHHDMGLIGNFLHPVAGGFTAVIMSPFQWLRQPKLLYQAMHHYHGTLCYMPNFAFNYSVQGVRAADLAGLNLNSMRRLMNGAEPVRYDSIRLFVEKFGPYGLTADKIKPSYGMAENVLGIATAPAGEMYYVEWIDRRRFQQENLAILTSPEAEGAMPQVSSGKAMWGTEVKITDDAYATLPDRQVGNILLRSPYLFNGYYHRPELSADLFIDGWFVTGDLGYLFDGHIFVTGRKKDLIIVGGKNIHPPDLEEIAQTVPGVYPGRVVVFGLENPKIGSEEVVLVAELLPGVSAEQESQIMHEIRHRIVQHSEVALKDVRLVRERWVIKTSSGKTARTANREQYLAQFGR